MKSLIRLSVVLLIFTALDAHAQTATIITQAQMYENPSDQSRVIKQLDTGTQVSEILRQGGWKKIEHDASITGWVRSHKVRQGSIVIQEQKKQSGGFFSSLASWSRKASGLFSSEKKGYSFQRTATIGVRGLSEEQIKHAKPDYKQLDKMESFRSNNNSARLYAKAGNLKADKVPHMPKSGAEK